MALPKDSSEKFGVAGALFKLFSMSFSCFNYNKTCIGGFSNGSNSANDE
jgi:hypothetical protein